MLVLLIPMRNLSAETQDFNDTSGVKRESVGEDAYSPPKADKSFLRALYAVGSNMASQ